MTNNKHFNLYSRYYNLLYKDKDYARESEYVFNKIKKYTPEISNLLEIGTGTGIHASLLKDKGIEVTGIEVSEEMAQQARSRGVECFINDCSDFKLNKKFDAAISLFHVISYITENDKLIKAFNNIYDHLNPGGVFLFDVWYSPAVHNLKLETRVKRIKDNDISITRLAEPLMHYNRNVADVNYEIIIEEKNPGKITKIKEIHPMRYFSIPEIELLSEMCGFYILETEEWLSGKEPSENTWGICFILKKRLK